MSTSESSPEHSSSENKSSAGDITDPKSATPPPQKDSSIESIIEKAKPNLRKQLSKSINQIRKNATYWGEKLRRDADVAQYYTLTATLIMSTNIFLKENIKNVGGWVPFCLAGTLLAGVATWLLSRLRAEDATQHRNNCFRLLPQYEKISRDLDMKLKWSQRAWDNLRKELEKADSESALYRIDTPKDRATFRFYVFMWVIVGSYILYEIVRLYLSWTR